MRPVEAVRRLGPVEAVKRTLSRERTAHRAVRLAERLTSQIYLPLDYPPSAADVPRYGWDRPPHPGLEAVLARHDDRYAAEPGWIQEPQWLAGMDVVSLYGYVRLRKPRRYLEIGSGNSTKFVARAKRDGALDTDITSVDPQPRSEVNQLCDRVVRQPLETVDLSLIEHLEAGDLVFFDGSHRAFMNSDVTTFFLDVLPALPPGVLVGVHDILLPWDYPPHWARRYYSEQYLLAACLLSGGGLVQPRLPCHYAHLHPELCAILQPLWSDPRLRDVDPRGFAFWFTTGAAAAPR
jgi:predicted O-methyltransferase YrrM